MKYLSKEPFSIAVSDRYLTERTKRPAPRVPHEYVPYGAVCFECLLDKAGCQEQYGVKKEEK